METEKLKPCPFCGNHVMPIRDPEGQMNEFFCGQCAAHVKWTIKMKPRETFGENMKRWTDKWNRRAER